MTDRDTFAAAALTGLLAQGDDGSFSEESYVRAAYRWADAMLAARTPPAKPSGVAEAYATAQQISDAQDFVRYREEFEAWKNEFEEWKKSSSNAAPAAKARTDADRGSTDKAVTRPGEGTGNAHDPVAWAVIGKERMACHVIGLHDTWLEAQFRVGRMVSHGECHAVDKVEIVPLYRHPSPTLTDEEREAIEGVIAVEHQRGAWRWADTLRKLLERTK